MRVLFEIFVVAMLIIMFIMIAINCCSVENITSIVTEEADRLSQELRDESSLCRKAYINLKDDLTTEIACLATKNNEDIKRVGGKFEEWDLIELDENEVLIYSAKPNVNGQMVFHCVDKAGKMYTFFSLDKHDVKFLRHTSSPFGEN